MQSVKTTVSFIVMLPRRLHLKGSMKRCQNNQKAAEFKPWQRHFESGEMLPATFLFLLKAVLVLLILWQRMVHLPSKTQDAERNGNKLSPNCNGWSKLRKLYHGSSLFLCLGLK